MIRNRRESDHSDLSSANETGYIWKQGEQIGDYYMHQLKDKNNMGKDEYRKGCERKN